MLPFLAAGCSCVMTVAALCSCMRHCMWARAALTMRLYTHSRIDYLLLHASRHIVLCTSCYTQVHSVRRKCILAELSLKPAVNTTANTSDNNNSSRGQLLRWRWLGPATIALVYATEVCYWAVVASSGAAQPLRRGFKRSAEVITLCNSVHLDSGIPSVL
jgi:hypothetical protein